MKKVISLILCIALAAGITGCAGNVSKSKVGTGTPGVVEEIDWHEYDDLLDAASREADLEKRSLLLHKAEDLLMDTYAVIPTHYGVHSYVLKKEVSGVFKPASSAIDISKIKLDGSDGTIPLNVRVCSEIPNLDCASQQTADLSVLYKIVSATLVKADENDVLKPQLAEEVDVSNDGLTYTFTLREGLKWSDGTPLTADDFVYSWNRVANSKSGSEAQSMFDCIEGFPDNLNIESKNNGRVFVVHLNKPTAYFPCLCAYTAFAPVQKKQVEGAAGYKDGSGKVVNPYAWATEAGIVTCGPYVPVEWKHNESMTLKKNPYYYDAENIPTDTIVLMLSNDNAAVYGAYVADTLVLDFGCIPADVIPTLMNNPEFHKCDGITVAAFVFNVNCKVFEGMTKEEARLFRKAISMLIDREFITKVALKTGQKKAYSYIPPYIHDGTGRTFGEVTAGYEYPIDGGYFEKDADVNGARELLRSIGFEFGKDGKLKDSLTIDYMYTSNVANETLATCLQADLAQLGINLNLSSREWSVYLGERRNLQHETVTFNWNADYDDPYGMLVLFKKEDANNCAGLGQAEKYRKYN